MISCTPVNLSKQVPKNTQEKIITKKSISNTYSDAKIKKIEEKDNNITENVILDKKKINKSISKYL